MSVVANRAAVDPDAKIPRLRAGDRMHADDFCRRFAASPDVWKAELIAGTVRLPPPVLSEQQAQSRAGLLGWLGFYCLFTPGIRAGDNGSIRLDIRNMPQPDAYLRILSEVGGRSRTVDGYLLGGPELVAEIAESSVGYDLLGKLDIFRRHEIPEYVVWRTEEGEIDWYILHGTDYRKQPLAEDGVYRSQTFPGLWLDVTGILANDSPRVMRAIQAGVATPEHKEFVIRMKSASERGP